MQTFCTSPLSIGQQRETYGECRNPALCMERDENTFDTRERPEPCTPTLAPQFQYVIQHAIVGLSNTDDRELNPCFCSIRVLAKWSG